MTEVSGKVKFSLVMSPLLAFWLHEPGKLTLTSKPSLVKDRGPGMLQSLGQTQLND